MQYYIDLVNVYLLVAKQMLLNKEHHCKPLMDHWWGWSQGIEGSGGCIRNRSRSDTRLPDWTQRCWWLVQEIILSNPKYETYKQIQKLFFSRPSYVYSVNPNSCLLHMNDYSSLKMKLFMTGLHLLFQTLQAKITLYSVLWSFSITCLCTFACHRLYIT